MATVVSQARDSFFFRLGLYAFSLSANALIARALGPAGRGRYFLPLITATTAQSLCMLSLEQVNVYLAGTRGYASSRLSAQNGLIALVMGGIGIGLVIAAPAVFTHFFSDTPLMLLFLAGLTIPFVLHINSSAGLLTLNGQVVWPFTSRCAGVALQFMMVVALYKSHRLTPASVLTTFLAGTLVNWIMVGARLEGRAVFRFGWDGPLLRETLRHTLLIHCGMVLWFLHLRADLFMTKAAFGMVALGQYSLAVTLAETTLLLTDSLSRAILPQQISSHTHQAAMISLRASRVNLLIGMLAGTGWLVGGPWLIPLCFGAAFRPACLPLILLMPGVTFVGMQQVCGGAVLRDGKPWKFPVIYGVSLALNIGLNVILMPTLGIAGASVASSISYGIGLIMFLRWTARLAEASLWEGLIPDRADFIRLYQVVTRRRSALAGNLAPQKV